MTLKSFAEAGKSRGHEKRPSLFSAINFLQQVAPSWCTGWEESKDGSEYDWELAGGLRKVKSWEGTEVGDWRWKEQRHKGASWGQVGL